MNFVYIFFIVLFTASCLYVAYSYFTDMMKNKNKDVAFVENKEFLHKAATVDTTFFFFHTDWCPHCKDSMEVWNAMEFHGVPWYSVEVQGIPSNSMEFFHGSPWRERWFPAKN